MVGQPDGFSNRPCACVAVTKPLPDSRPHGQGKERKERATRPQHSGPTCCLERELGLIGFKNMASYKMEPQGVEMWREMGNYSGVAAAITIANWQTGDRLGTRGTGRGVGWCGGILAMGLKRGKGGGGSLRPCGLPVNIFQDLTLNTLAESPHLRPYSAQRIALACAYSSNPPRLGAQTDYSSSPHE